MDFHMEELIFGSRKLIFIGVHVRGKGLLNAIVLNCDESSNIPWDICLKMRDNGLLAKPTQGNKIRFAPPLIIEENQLLEALKIIEDSIREFD